MSLHPLQLTPQFHHRVWGGTQFTTTDQPIGEAWIVYESNVIANGEYAGLTLAQVTASHAVDLLGAPTLNRTGNRFPLLIKILDCADWLSLQVHPNDEQAKRLEGDDQFGKTEAWHILRSENHAKLISGLKPNTTAELLANAIRNGTILDHVDYHPTNNGDTILIRAGTIHALGPGLLLYEVQQTSDLTYRVFDWNRPQANGRLLHIEKSLAVANPLAIAEASPQPSLKDGEAKTLVKCEYFTLDLMIGDSQPIALNTHGDSFHAITITEGVAKVEGDGWSYNLKRFESVVVPASCGEYAIHPQGSYRALKSSVA